jgi:hypothetical protein
MPTLPPSLTQFWAHFVFAAQPRAGSKVTVTWYFPDGKQIGTVPKANRPEVTSFLRSNFPIPVGTWRAELRAGGRVVQVLGVRVAG